MAPMRTKKGITLVEMMISMFIFIILLGVASGTFIYLNRIYSKSSSSYDVEREMQTGVEQIRRDLMESSLSSIVVYPKGNGIIPGVSMISAEMEEVDPSGPDKRYFKVTRYGTPDWSRHVFYTLQRVNVPQAAGTSFEGNLANLVRWTLPIDSKTIDTSYPFPTDVFPSHFQQKNQPPRVILRGIPLPGAPGLHGIDHYTADDKNYSGFQVGFIYLKKGPQGSITGEYLSSTNPCQATDKNLTDGTTKLVQVNLTNVFFSERSGKMSANSYSFQVNPRH